MERQVTSGDVARGGACLEPLHFRPQPVLGPRALATELQEQALACESSLEGVCFLSGALPHTSLWSF